MSRRTWRPRTFLARGMRFRVVADDEDKKEMEKLKAHYWRNPNRVKRVELKYDKATNRWLLGLSIKTYPKGRLGYTADSFRR